MINTISIKNTATYDENGIIIEELRPINFIYGANGTGKTTISNFLKNIGDSKYSECDLVWKNEPLETLVYNREFRDENFGESSKIKGVFTLGKATKEQLEQIKEKEEKANSLREEIIKQRETLNLKKGDGEKLDSSIKEKLWTGYYKKNEDFKEALRGSLKQDTFYSSMLKNYKENNLEVLKKEDLLKKLKTLYDDNPQELDLISIFDSSRILELIASEIWQQKIVGKSDIPIGNLINRLQINDWVNQGKSYLEDESETCPFCQKETIDESFRQELEEFFDKSFNESIKRLKNEKDELERLSEVALNHYRIVLNGQKELKDSKLSITEFEAHLNTLSEQINLNKEYLRNKEKEPSRKVELTDIEPVLKKLENISAGANQLIKDHNSLVININNEKKNLVQLVWKFLVNEANNDIKSYLSEKDDLNKAIDGIQNSLNNKAKDWKEIDKEIKELTKDKTDVQATVIEINSILKSFGFLNFEIQPTSQESKEYHLVRNDNTPVESTLSEGEVTFITFLYFLCRAKGGDSEDTILNPRILVIDDPISSLDSNVLFVVSTLIKEVIEKVKSGESVIKQVIVLTHNVYFHKEVTFLDGRNNPSNKVHYWILRKKGVISNIQAFQQKNPINTTYELLWKELREKDRNSGVAIQNIMRRIIENYFRILGKKRDDELISKFDNAQDQEICRSLLSWVNDGSHSISDELYVEDPADIISRYFEVFESLFQKTDHYGHYKMMMQIEDEVDKNVLA